MRVYLCEKPAQARDIARVVGQPVRKEGYLQVGNTAFTWCVGHLFEQVEPDAYHPDYKRWSLDHLPIIPEVWKLKPRARVESQIKAIRGLLKHAAEVVIATDPDREGEVIGREVLDELRYRGPVRRLLLSALDAASIRKGLDAIRSGDETVALYHAGLGRSRADWLVGMNLTRAWTLIGRGRGAEGVTSIGRVQTPTLNLIVERDLRIEDFTPTDYFTVEASCRHADATFEAAWVPNAEQLEALCDREGRCIKHSAAEQIAAALKAQGSAAVTAAERQAKRVTAPLPFALSDLQQLGNKLWGYGAKETLEIAQSLYEKHKAISYPRSDTGYLPVDQHAEAGGVVAALKTAFGAAEYPHFYQNLDLAQQSRAWNDAKVTAHHGIVPTASTVPLAALNEQERNVYRLIAARYLMQFMPDHEFETVRLELVADGIMLEAKGKRTLSAGWKAAAATGSERTEPTVPYLEKGTEVVVDEASVTDRQTKPPARYTEGTLIKAMTRVAGEVDDPEMRAVLREHDGIGTEATRAEIIQTLLGRGFIEARKKSLYSTPKGRTLIGAIPKALKDPTTTALMERMLSEVASGNTSLAQFMTKQQELVSQWVEDARQQMLSGGAQPNAPGGACAPPQPDKKLGACPECGKPLRSRRGRFGAFVGCSGYPDCRYIQKRAGGGVANGAKAAAKPGAATAGKTCAACGSAMVLRKGKRGEFFGCSTYPQCKHTAQVGRSSGT